MPKQGVSSSFKFGMSFGKALGILETLQVPYDLVTPHKWQKEVFDSASKQDTKAMALDRARRLFPELTGSLRRKKDHNRADALLIAEYCRRTHK
jgi:crossover junction endodeoxyribonuclease RuvC